PEPNFKDYINMGPDHEGMILERSCIVCGDDVLQRGLKVFLRNIEEPVGDLHIFFTDTALNYEWGYENVFI
ncbi:28912_t:CDS:1, partial [Racocetra persica]